MKGSIPDAEREGRCNEREGGIVGSASRRMRRQRGEQEGKGGGGENQDTVTSEGTRQPSCPCPKEQNEGHWSESETPGDGCRWGG